jgi:hypothetical protein
LIICDYARNAKIYQINTVEDVKQISSLGLVTSQTVKQILIKTIDTEKGQIEILIGCEGGEIEHLVL